MIAFYVNSIYPTSIGGMEIFYFHFIRAISKTRTVMLFSDKQIDIGENIRTVRIPSNLFVVRRFGFGKLSIAISMFYMILKYNSKIKILHLPCTSNTGFYGHIFPLLNFIFGLRYIIYFHGGGMRKWRWLDGNRSLFRHADKIIAVSDVIKNEYEKRCRRPIDVILPLVPFNIAAESKVYLKNKYGYTSADLVVGMVGSLKKLKGTMFVLKSFLRLTKTVFEKEGLKLLFVGDGIDKNEMQSIIDEAGMNKYVKIIPRIINEDIHEIFKLLDVYIIASDFEGTSKSLLEAMHNKLPILASNVNGINNVIHHNVNGLLFEKENPEPLIDGLKKYINSTDLRNRCGEYAFRTFAVKYDFKVALKSWLSVYDTHAKQ